jgi:hypothetical protein
MHEYQSRRNLEILLAVLLKRKLPILQYVTEQIKYGLQRVGCNKTLLPLSQRYAKSYVSYLSLASILLLAVLPFLSLPSAV